MQANQSERLAASQKKGHLALVTFFLVGFILAALPPNINRWELHAITFDVGC